jgi:hypothetical protein
LSEDTDLRLRRIVDVLIPVVKARMLLSWRLSPETFVQELETLASLYVVRRNLPSAQS